MLPNQQTSELVKQLHPDPVLKGNMTRPQFIGLAHELGHALDLDKGCHPTGSTHKEQEAGSSAQLENAVRDYYGIPVVDYTN